MRAGEASAIRGMSGRILEASDNEWRAAAWYLERRDPLNFAKRDKLELSGRVDSVGVTVNVDAMREDIPDAALLKILQRVLMPTPEEPPAIDV